MEELIGIKSSIDNCEFCKHCKGGEVNPDTLKRQAVCMLNPPQTFPVPTAQGLAMVTTYPHVTDKMICSHYDEISRII